MHFEKLPGIPVHKLASDESKAKIKEFNDLGALMEKQDRKWWINHEKLATTDDEGDIIKSRTAWRKLMKEKVDKLTAMVDWAHETYLPELSKLYSEQAGKLPEIESSVVDRLVSIGFLRSTTGRGSFPPGCIFQHPEVRDHKDLLNEIDGFQNSTREIIKLCLSAIERIEQRLADSRAKSLAL